MGGKGFLHELASRGLVACGFISQRATAVFSEHLAEYFGLFPWHLQSTQVASGHECRIIGGELHQPLTVQSCFVPYRLIDILRFQNIGDVRLVIQVYTRLERCLGAQGGNGCQILNRIQALRDRGSQIADLALLGYRRCRVKGPIRMQLPVRGQHLVHLPRRIAIDVVHVVGDLSVMKAHRPIHFPNVLHDLKVFPHIGRVRLVPLLARKLALDRTFTLRGRGRRAIRQYPRILITVNTTGLLLRRDRHRFIGLG